jgi:hypothetical protein
MLEGGTYSEIAETKLPPGYGVEELPPSVALESTFGSYSAGVDRSFSRAGSESRCATVSAWLSVKSCRTLWGTGSRGSR